MGRTQPANYTLSITMDREVGGESLVFIAETRNAAEVAELEELVRELQHGCKVRLVSLGPVTAFAVKPKEDADEAVSSLVEVARILQAISPRYTKTYLQQFDATAYRIVEDLALETGARLQPLPQCDLCGKLDPFPTTLHARDGDNVSSSAGTYCSHCVASMSAASDRQLVADLIHADRRNFGTYGSVQLAKTPRRRGRHLSFTACACTDAVAATG
jgi:hypothetical protein